MGKKKELQTKKTTTKKVNVSTKGFNNVPETALTNFEKIKGLIKQPGEKKKTDTETLVYIIDNFLTLPNTGSSSEDQTKINELLQTIEQLKLENKVINEELEQAQILKNEVTSMLSNDFNDLQSKHQKLNESLNVLIQAIGAPVYEDAILKAKLLNSNPFSDEERNKLNEALAEVERLKAANNELLLLGNQVEQITNLVYPAIREAGFEEFTDFVNDYNKKKEVISHLNEKLETVLAGSVQLNGNEFIASLNQNNFDLAGKYRSTLFNTKIITSDNENFPNDLINWAVPIALKVHFGKL